jgi:hypothetical protein
MPASTRGRLRDNLTFVLINPVFAYGWNAPDLAAASGVSQADLTTGLGHMEAAAAAAVANVVMVTGANAPKPMRVTKALVNAPIGQSASVSTFCAYNKLATANGVGFKRSGYARSVRLTAPSASRRTFSGIVELSNGLLYLQPVDAQAATADRRAVLGMQTAAEISSTELLKVARGSTDRPGRAEIPLGEGGLVASLPFSTAAEDDVKLQEGWSIIQSESVAYTAAAGGGGG